MTMVLPQVWKPISLAAGSRRVQHCLTAVLLLAGVLICLGCVEQSANPSPELLEQLIGKKEPPPIPVGVLFSQTGSMSISETQLKHVVIQAIDEINAAGGVLGRRLEPIIEDGRTREDIFAKRARELIESRAVPVIFGGWRSSDRKAMLPIIEQADALLFYPLQYEGNESSRNVFYGGMTPNQQVLPALDWFMSPEGGSRQRVFLVGSDYVFPWTVNHIVRKYLEGKGMQVVGEQYVPFDHKDFDQVYQAIKASNADLILSTINGQSNISFFREYRLQGLDPQSTPIFSTSIGEAGLRSIPAALTTGHYAAWNFFQSLDTQSARAFVRRFQDEYGSDRPVHDPMESAYSQVYLWREAVEKAGSFAAADVRKILEQGVSVAGPAGTVKVDPKNHHTYKLLRIGRILPNQQYEILYESPDLLPPDPYPGFAFPGWSCDWTAGGLQAGPAVELEH
ncbi:MAG: urea ABC transporter substrate-binding protein [Planctomycetota bacterium]|jgi:urea ABC transporter urea binding protein